jgi:hypothetical protein
MIFTADLKDAKTGAVQRVAVKVPRTDCEDPAVAEHDLEVELDILRGLHHKHIIKLVCTTYQCICTFIHIQTYTFTLQYRIVTACCSTQQMHIHWQEIGCCMRCMRLLLMHTYMRLLTVH